MTERLTYSYIFCILLKKQSPNTAFQILPYFLLFINADVLLLILRILFYLEFVVYLFQVMHRTMYPSTYSSHQVGQAEWNLVNLKGCMWNQTSLSPLALGVRMGLTGSSLRVCCSFCYSDQREFHPLNDNAKRHKGGNSHSLTIQWFKTQELCMRNPSTNKG